MSGLGVSLRTAAAITELAMSLAEAALILPVCASLDRGLVDDDKIERLTSGDPLHDAAARVECAQKLVSGGALKLRRKLRNDLPHADGGERLHFRGAGV